MLTRFSELRNKEGFLRDERGQDLVEYALMAGVVAVGAGSMIPPMAGSISSIFSKAMSVLEKFS